jgi:hypothetical protein
VNFFDGAQGAGGVGAVIDEGDEAGEVAVVLGDGTAGDFKAGALVFDADEDPGLGFGDAAEPGFPVAVQDDPGNVAFAGIGLPAAGFTDDEADVDTGTCGLAGVEEGFDRAAVDERLAYGVDNFDRPLRFFRLSASQNGEFQGGFP